MLKKIPGKKTVLKESTNMEANETQNGKIDTSKGFILISHMF